MQRLLEKVWRRMEIEYKLGHINSERCMQAFYYHALRSERECRNLRIFIEPEMAVQRKRYPDIVVCDGDAISAMLELKFVPHGYAKFDSDLNKLLDFSKSTRSSFLLELIPQSGRFSDRRFYISSGTLLVFAAISRYDARAVSESDIRAKISGHSTVKVLHQRGLIGKPCSTGDCLFEQSVIRGTAELP